MTQRNSIGMTGFAGIAGMALLLMGATGPSCGGTQALQQQLDQANAKSLEQAKSVQELQAQVKVLQTEMGNVKALAQQIGNTVLAQKRALEQYDAAIRSSRAAPVRSSPSKKATTRKPVRSKAARQGRH